MTISRPIDPVREPSEIRAEGLYAVSSEQGTKERQSRRVAGRTLIRRVLAACLADD